MNKTHSHDTATPALSVEREARPTVNEYAADYYFAGDGGDHTPTEGERAMIEDAINGYLAEIAAPAPNPSPAAKGGEAVVVPYDDFHAAYGFVPRSKVSPDRCLKTRLRALLRAEDLAHADEAEALATPSPQPADAVREALEPALPRDVIELVLAARAVAFEGDDERNLLALDRASEAFASRVPWDGEDDAAIASNPAPAGEAVEPTLDNTEPHSLEFMKWLWRAYRQPADGNLDARMFTRWNMEVAYHAGKQAEAASHPAPEDTARLREDLERVTRQCEFYRNSLAHEIDNRDEALRERDDARKALEETREEFKHSELLRKAAVSACERLRAASSPEGPIWGRWFDYDEAPAGSYSCLCKQGDGAVSIAWMPGQGRPRLSDTLVMPFDMPARSASREGASDE